MKSSKSVTIDGVDYIETDIGYSKKVPAYSSEEKKMRFKNVTLSSGVIEPRQFITMPGGVEHLIGRVKGSDVLIRRRDWDSASQFKSAFNSMNFSFLGKDTDVQALMKLIHECYPNIPRKKGVSVIGRHDDIYVFPKFNIGKDGLIDKDKRDTLFLGDGHLIFDEESLPGAVRITEASNPASLVRSFYELIMKVNRPKTIVPIVAMKFAQSFAPQIRESFRKFPPVFGFGTSGSGKSTTAAELWRMQGIRKDVYSCDKTQFTLIKLLSSTNTIPIVLDEFKGDMRKDSRNFLIRTLRESYTGTTTERGKSDQTVVQYPLLAPIELYGEVFYDEKAIKERVIPVCFDNDIPQIKEFRESFINLKRLDLEAFPSVYLPWTLSVDFNSVWETSTKRLDCLTSTLNLPDRVRHNLNVMFFGASLFEEFGKHFSLSVSLDSELEQATESILEFLIDKETGKTKGGLDHFLQHLSVMAGKKEIKRGIDYEIDSKSFELYVNLPSCISSFKAYAKRTDLDGEVLNEDAYRRQAKENQQTGGYVKSVSEQKYFYHYIDSDQYRRSQKRCMVIDLNKVSYLDLDGFDYENQFVRAENV